MDEKSIDGASTGELQEQAEVAGARGFGRGRFLVAAGGAAVGLTALSGLSGTDTAEAAVAGQYFKPDDFFGKEEPETDRSAAIKKADEKAAEVGGYVLFGPRTYKFKNTLRFSAPWVGVPRRTILEAQSGFKYAKVAELEQFVALNANFSRTFGTTADNVLLEGIDWLINTDSGSAGKGSIGLGNVAGGVIRDCQFSTAGTSTMGAMLDLYSCVQGVEIDRVRIVNLTEGIAGVGLNVRNLASEKSGIIPNTERIVIRDSYVGTSTADEAIAIYGVLGLTTNVRVFDTTVVALPSKEEHVHIASTFPLSNKGANTKAGVEDVEWRGCRFIDESGKIKSGGNLLAFGQEFDESNLCQNIRAVNCTFVLQNAGATVVGVRNIVNKFEGVGSGNFLESPRVDASKMASEIDAGIVGFPEVQNPVILGKVSEGIRNCGRVIGGVVEASTRAFHGCGEVSSVTVKLTGATGVACYHDNAKTTTASMRGCLIEGGQSLFQTGKTAPPEACQIDVTDNRMIVAATSGAVVGNTSKVLLRLVGNTVTGAAGLTFPAAGFSSVTRIQSIINDWNGTFEGA
jgi:hypothetical protein